MQLVCAGGSYSSARAVAADFRLRNDVEGAEAGLGATAALVLEHFWPDCLRSLLQNSIETARRGEFQGTTSVVPEEPENRVGL
jgi:hypothetical protein